MKKLKKVGYTAAGATGGAVVGGVVFSALAPFHAVGDLFAPITYPTMSSINGAIAAHARGKNPLFGAGIGCAVGVCCIPLAPLHFVQRPFQGLVGAAAGAVAGGVLAYKAA